MSGLWFRSRWLVAAICCCFVADVFSQTKIATTKDSTTGMDGDLAIALLFPGHQENKTRTSNLDFPNICGKLIPNSISLSVQFARTIDAINSDPSLLGGLKLGYSIFDSCSLPYFAAFNPIYALELRQIDDKNVAITSDNDAMQLPLAFFVGTFRDEESAFAAKVFQLYDVPMIDVATSAALLSDRTKFPLYARVSSSDIDQAAAIADFLANFLDAKCVSVLYSEGVYGESGSAELRKHLKKLGICQTVFAKLSSSSNVQEVAASLNKDSTKIIVCFCQPTLAKRIFSLIDSSSWNGLLILSASATDDNVGDDYSRLSSKSIGLIKVTADTSPPSDEFSKWIADNWSGRLNDPSNSNRYGNKWVQEWHDSCPDNNCQDGVTKNRYLDQVNIAVLAGVKATKTYLEAVCPRRNAGATLKERCGENLKKLLQNGTALFKFLKNTSLNLSSSSSNDSTSLVFSFNDNMEAPGKYTFSFFGGEFPTSHSRSNEVAKWAVSSELTLFTNPDFTCFWSQFKAKDCSTSCSKIKTPVNDSCYSRNPPYGVSCVVVNPLKPKCFTPAMTLNNNNNNNKQETTSGYSSAEVAVIVLSCLLSVLILGLVAALIYLILRRRKMLEILAAKQREQMTANDHQQQPPPFPEDSVYHGSQ